MNSASKQRPPLREFVYLDDVSLRSLLASQKGELTEQVTELLSQADEAELAGTAGAASPILTAEVTSRFQRTSAKESQYARKAVVQSLFKELRELDWIEVLLQLPTGAAADSTAALIKSSAAVPVSELRRGRLVEVEVELVADPIFRFSTIASELAQMAEDFPEMMDDPAARNGMDMLVPGNRVLQRFLVGLVPLRAVSTSHVVARIESTEFVVPRSDAESLGIECEPLVIVGVTEQGNYWRDVRRVLFSRARCTMLCRVSRDGLQTSWVPVKLTDVLKEVVPTFPDVMANVGQIGLGAAQTSTNSNSHIVVEALEKLLDGLMGVSEAAPPTSEAIQAAHLVIAGVEPDLPNTATAHNEAFRMVIQALTDNGYTLSSDRWAELTRSARKAASLPAFGNDPTPGADVVSSADDKNRLLDTEIIAIYW